MTILAVFLFYPLFFTLHHAGITPAFAAGYEEDQGITAQTTPEGTVDEALEAKKKKIKETLKKLEKIQEA